MLPAHYTAYSSLKSSTCACLTTNNPFQCQAHALLVLQMLLGHGEKDFPVTHRKHMRTRHIEDHDATIFHLIVLDI